MPAPLRFRLAVAFIDAVIALALTLGVVAALAEDLLPSSLGPTFATTVWLAYLAPDAFWGASPAKLAFGLRVRSANGEPAPARALFLRFFLKHNGVFIPLVLGFSGVAMEGVVAVIASVPALIVLAGVFLALRPEGRSLHDLLTRTAVFRARDLATSTPRRFALIGAFAGTALLVTVVSSFATTRRDEPLRRLVALVDARPDLTAWIGVGIEGAMHWCRVIRADGFSVYNECNAQVFTALNAPFVVAYPSGFPIDMNRVFRPLPDGVRMPEVSDAPVAESIALADLTEGNRLLDVTFARSPARPEDPEAFTVIATNVSEARLRVLRFGGYREAERGRFVLDSAFGRLFDEGEFREWYLDDDWLEPGESVSDPSAYGARPSLWAYFISKEGSDRELAAGGIAR